MYLVPHTSAETSFKNVSISTALVASVSYSNNTYVSGRLGRAGRAPSLRTTGLPQRSWMGADWGRHQVLYKASNFIRVPNLTR